MTGKKKMSGVVRRLVAIGGGGAQAKRATGRRAMPNVARAPFGIQQACVLRAMGDNGVEGKFRYPLQKLLFTYCDLGGSSQGMREFIKTQLVEFARAHPQLEVLVQPRPFHHPHIRAYYDNGHQKYVCVRNAHPSTIRQFVEQYRDTHGLDPIRPKQPVLSQAESLRGIWTPFKDVRIRPAHQPLAPSFLYSNNI